MCGPKELQVPMRALICLIFRPCSVNNVCRIFKALKSPGQDISKQTKILRQSLRNNFEASRDLKEFVCM